MFSACSGRKSLICVWWVCGGVCVGFVVVVVAVAVVGLLLLLLLLLFYFLFFVLFFWGGSFTTYWFLIFNTHIRLFRLFFTVTARTFARNLNFINFTHGYTHSKLSFVLDLMSQTTYNRPTRTAVWRSQLAIMKRYRFITRLCHKSLRNKCPKKFQTNFKGRVPFR